MALCYDSIDEVQLPSMSTMTRLWTRKEDTSLRKAVISVKSNGVGLKESAWKSIAAQTFDKSVTPAQCSQRWKVLTSQDKCGVKRKRGKWSPEEDDALRAAIKRNGAKVWTIVATSVPGRNGKQCRERWHHHLHPNVNKAPWSASEEQLLIELHSQHGNKWAFISRHFQGRTDNAIKNHWNASNYKRNEKRKSRKNKTHSETDEADNQPNQAKAIYGRPQDSQSPIQPDIRAVSSVFRFPPHALKFPDKLSPTSSEAMMSGEDRLFVASITGQYDSKVRGNSRKRDSLGRTQQPKRPSPYRYHPTCSALPFPPGGADASTYLDITAQQFIKSKLTVRSTENNKSQHKPQNTSQYARQQADTSNNNVLKLTQQIIKKKIKLTQAMLEASRQIKNYPQSNTAIPSTLYNSAILHNMQQSTTQLLSWGEWKGICSKLLAVRENRSPGPEKDHPSARHVKQQRAKVGKLSHRVQHLQIQVNRQIQEISISKQAYMKQVDEYCRGGPYPHLKGGHPYYQYLWLEPSASEEDSESTVASVMQQLNLKLNMSTNTGTENPDRTSNPSKCHLNTGSNESDDNTLNRKNKFFSQQYCVAETAARHCYNYVFGKLSLEPRQHEPIQNIIADIGNIETLTPGASLKQMQQGSQSTDSNHMILEWSPPTTPGLANSTHDARTSNPVNYFYN